MIGMTVARGKIKLEALTFNQSVIDNNVSLGYNDQMRSGTPYKENKLQYATLQACFTLNLSNKQRFNLLFSFSTWSSND